MAGPKLLRRVSWAPGVSLFQVRLFLSEDAPSQSGLGNQDHLQAKAAWLLHSSSSAPDDSVPPGFESFHWGQVESNIPLIKWQCPPNQKLKPEWRVVAAEESQEVALQDQRHLRVLEAVYPRLSSIPLDPSVSPEVQLAHFDDSQTLLIPIIAIEDEDAAEPDFTISSQFISSKTGAPELSLPGTVPLTPKLLSALQPPSASCSLGSVMGVEPDIAAAASAAFTAIMRSNEEGSLIDRDLLIKILRDPSMVGKLVSEHSAAKQTLMPSQPLPQTGFGATHPMPVLIPASSPSLNPSPRSSATISINIPRDVNYYKSLIQKHGGDRQESAEPTPLPYENHHYSNPLRWSMHREGAEREMRQSESRKPKIARPCAYFNTPRGCRQGTSCSYLHDSSASKKIERQRESKRVKFDR